MVRLAFAAVLLAALASLPSAAQPPAPGAAARPATAFPVTDGDWSVKPGRQIFDALRFRERIDEARRAAMAGDVNAMTLLAIAHLDGDGVARDPAAALRWAEQAAAAGSLRGLRTLGAIHLRGEGVPQDVPRARELLERAYRGGNLMAAVDIAAILQRGEGGTPRDPVRALALFREAAALDIASAHGGIAAAYHNGDGVAQDFALAFRAAREGAVRDDGFSAYILARLYDTGRGVDRDSERARGWLEIAALNDSEEAMRALQWTPETVARVRRWGPYARLTNRRLRHGGNFYRYHWREPGRVLVMTYGNLDDLGEIDAEFSWPDGAAAPASDNREWGIRLFDGALYEEVRGILYRMVPTPTVVSRMLHARSPDRGPGNLISAEPLATVSLDEYDRLVAARRARDSAAQQAPAQGQPAADH